MQTNNPNASANNIEKMVDTILRLLVLFLILDWCFGILQPFGLVLIWAAVIAIAAYPLHHFFTGLLGGRKTLAAVVLVLLLLSILVVPAMLVSASMYEGISHITQNYKEGQPLIPPPGGNTASWPSITKPLVDIWQKASENLQATALSYADQLKTVGSWLLSAFAGVGKGILQFVVSIIVAGVFLVYTEPLKKVSGKVFGKLAGSNGVQFANITVTTIRNVVKGILGVSFIQAAMAGVGFFIAGVPFAGLWTMAGLVLAIMQIGLGPVVIPVAIYMFSVSGTVGASILAVWLAITMLADNVLKPLLLGRNAPAPTLVILLGSIGGFIYNGFLGLFLGGVILTIGYKLFMGWIDTANEPKTTEPHLD